MYSTMPDSEVATAHLDAHGRPAVCRGRQREWALVGRCLPAGAIRQGRADFGAFVRVARVAEEGRVIVQDGHTPSLPAKAAVACREVCRQNDRATQ